MNNSSVTDDIWWQDENYGRKGNTINPFFHWLERNAFWLQLALVATMVTVIWIILTVKVFPEEIRDIYSSFKDFFIGIFSWRKTICRERNAMKTGSSYKARYLQQQDEEPQVRFEVVDERRTQTRKRKIPTASKSQILNDQQQNGRKRRTQVKIIDEIYGEIVGFQESPGPKFQFQNYKNPVTEREKVNSKNPRQKPLNHNICNERGLLSRCSDGAQPSSHIRGNNFKPLGNPSERTAARPRINIESANRSVPCFAMTASSVTRGRSMMSTSNSQIKPDIIRMREFAHRIRQERKNATKPIKNPAMDTKREQCEDLVETTV